MPFESAYSSDNELERLPRPGEVIAGKYRVEGALGAGGMGIVLTAHHLMLNQLVAVKLLHPRSAMRSAPVQRFLREARAAAAIRSEHVARVLDVGTLPSGDPFMVMEYLQGSPLSRVIRKRAPLPIDEAVDYILQACDAIGEAHQLGIIHRDLKPGNLFLTQRPNGTPLLKVLDFGLSKYDDPESDEHNEPLTSTNMVMGSPQYASPEQLRNSKHVDARTDIWALGVVLYYMLAGRRPFEAESISALCLAIASDPPVPLGAQRPDAPPELSAAVMRCLEKDRERRIPDVPTLVASLRPFAPYAAQPGLSPPRTPPALGAPFDASAPPTSPAFPSMDPQAATMLTRSAWTSPATSGRSGHVLTAIKATAVLGLATLIGAVFLKAQGASTAESRHVDAVSTDLAVSPVPTPTATASGDELVIDQNFAPAPQPPTAAPRPTTSPQPSSTARAEGAPQLWTWGITTKAVTLRDWNGNAVGTVNKGSRVQLVKEKDGRSLVVYSSNEGMTMGWAPSNIITPAP